MMRILLAEDHASSREPLAFMLEQEPDLTVAAQAASLAEAREALSEADPPVDFAIIDLDLPDGSGTELIGELHATNRRAQALILTAFSERGRIARAVEAGAAGVLHKSVRIRDVVSAVRRLGAGEQLLSPQEIGELSRLAVSRRRQDREAQARIERLTPREREVLQALAEGLGDREISARLYVSRATVQSHMVNILAKLEVASRLQALLFAARNGVVNLDEPL